MTDNRLCALTDLTEKARSIAKAAAELMLSDELIDADDIDSKDEKRQLSVWEVLRTHNTCGSLLHVLLDLFDRMDAELDGADRDELEKLHSPAPEQHSTAYTLEGGTRLADFARSLQKLTPEQLEQLDGSGDALPDQRGGAAQ